MIPTSPASCPLCPRPRRDDRPLCTNHMRRAGFQALRRYFARTKAHDAAPSDLTLARVNEAAEVLRQNAINYDIIFGEGYFPFWNTDREAWEHPVQRCERIIAGWVNARGVVGLSAGAIADMAAEIYPPVERGR